MKIILIIILMPIALLMDTLKDISTDYMNWYEGMMADHET